jgi:uridine kinase
MAHRAEQEGASPSAQRRRTVERLHELLEVSDIPLQCIRLYRAIPTCSVIVAHGQRRLFLNPYTLGEIAENTLSLMLDGAAHPGAYDGFVYAHIDRPWCSNALSGSLETFVAEQKTAVARQIARRIYEEYLRKRAKTPIVAAINGCTAAGKTGLATEVSACLSDEIAPRLSRVVLDTDGWISVSRAERISRHLTCCEPEAYDLPALQYALDRLAEGRDASNRAYDHRAGTPGQAGAIGSADVIIVDGLMSTHRTLNRTPDVSVWVQLSPDTHKRVRIERDVRERGYTPEEAAENWELHERAWPKFERLARPPDCILVRGDRARMLFVDD